MKLDSINKEYESMLRYVPEGIMIARTEEADNQSFGEFISKSTGLQQIIDNLKKSQRLNVIFQNKSMIKFT